MANAKYFRPSMNEVAKSLTLLEGQKHNLNIADIKEVLKCLRILCRNDSSIWSRVQDYLRYDKQDVLKRPTK